MHNNKMCALLQKSVCIFIQKVCIPFSLDIQSHTYKVSLRFRPSNIKMLSTRLGSTYRVENHCVLLCITLYYCVIL